jgi:hypothetical protein
MVKKTLKIKIKATNTIAHLSSTGSSRRGLPAVQPKRNPRTPTRPPRRRSQNCRLASFLLKSSVPDSSGTM